jgi:hypothetical protein
MTRILPTALVMGVIVGLLVAAYMNIFNVPVMEWAIALEGCEIDRAGCAQQLATAEDEAPLPLSFLISLGGQRIGMTVGLAVIGILYAAVFTGLYHLIRNATPGWSPWAWAAVAGLLGFWGVSMYTQIKFPLNPPGIGDEGTLLPRQGFQFLFIAVSTVSVALFVYGIGVVNRTSAASGRWLRYGGIGLAYAVVALLLAFAVPSVRDAAPAWLPPELTLMFRTFTAGGHFLLWMGIAIATIGYRYYREREVHAYPQAGGPARATAG